MYGCLGYNLSRFYAKPIAMLITSKGREILQNTVDLAEGRSYNVILKIFICIYLYNTILNKYMMLNLTNLFIINNH